MMMSNTPDIAALLQTYQRKLDEARAEAYADGYRHGYAAGCEDVRFEKSCNDDNNNVATE